MHFWTFVTSGEWGPLGESHTASWLSESANELSALNSDELDHGSILMGGVQSYPLKF